MNRRLVTYGPGAAPVATFSDHGVSVRLDHVAGDPEGVFRLYLERDGASLELCPSKGLSVRDTTLSGRQIFWDPPMENLPDPRRMRLEDPLLINGTLRPGMTWIAYFAAHVEMLGLFNWGMDRRDEAGRLLCLHGNVSMIPLMEVQVELGPGAAVVRGSFDVFGPNEVLPPKGARPVYRVHKRVELLSDRNALLITDRIENLDSTERSPDWGYHVQLRAEEGCRYVVPAARSAPRAGGTLPEDHQVWHSAADPKRRMERGFVHRGLDPTAVFPDGSPGCETRVEYPDGTQTRCVLPPAPYVMSWFSCGGAGGDGFRWPDGSPVLQKNWDGVGPEIGASDLDHRDNVDPEVTAPRLAPGESMTLNILIEAV